MDVDTRLDKLEALLKAAPVSCHRDLERMLNPICVKRTEMSRELIECRKRGRPTLHYNELLKEFNDLADNFEKYVMIATLSHGWQENLAPIQ